LFSQVDQSLEKAQGGLGIGLSLVKRLVVMHGGNVEARSEGLGRGSEFIIHLPQAVESQLKIHVDDQPQELQLSALKILIVDDNQDSANSLAIMLKFMANEIRTGYDGLEAVKLAAEFQPDVILLDIGLPKLNGYEACRQIRAATGNPDLVIIAQTGWGTENDQQRTQRGRLQSPFCEADRSESPHEDAIFH
jgi:CheY-like chemotaxis protein